MKKTNVIVYGAGHCAEILFKNIDKWGNKYKVISIADNDSDKWGTSRYGLEIVELSKALSIDEWDYVVLAVEIQYLDAYRTLREAGVDKLKIVSYYSLLGDDTESNGVHVKVGLVVIFNHRFENNLTKLRLMYKERFAEVLFLVPFYRGNEEDVYAVYESSYRYNAFINQAIKRIEKMNCDYYLFIGDDVIINPMINQNNIVGELNIYGKQAFIPYIRNLNCKGSYNLFWIKNGDAPGDFSCSGVNWEQELPKKNDAFLIFDKFFGRVPRKWQDFIFWNSNDYAKEEFLKKNGGTMEIAYPLAYGYTDFFVITKDLIVDMAHYFGVFDSLNVFVEAAIPTTLVMLIGRNLMVTGQEIKYYPVTQWGKDDLDILENDYRRDSRILLKEFPSGVLFIHPVKLSKWK